MGSPAPPSPAAGLVFANRFEIDRPVGAGGMGLVYRARDRYSGAWVALKVLHNSLEAAPVAARFLREAQLLSELPHPHIVSYVAHGENPDGRHFLAMEWLEGQDLSERLRQGPLDLQSALRLLEHVADGLAAAHQRGIIHRDLMSLLILVEKLIFDRLFGKSSEKRKVVVASEMCRRYA
jgi:serine/threonine protein kinase